ncbi:MAG: DUF1963 domain-containing protein [Acidimicrobiales bacterium]
MIPHEALTSSVDPSGELAPAVPIVGWEAFSDEPDAEDHADCGLLSSYDFRAKTHHLRCPSVGVDVTVGRGDIEVEEIVAAAEGDKLGGWPRWIQAAEYPACPTCGRQMSVLFQLDSNDHVPYMFGDMGIGHITQCPDHQNVVAFGWACG